MKYIIKRNGSKQPFNSDKIINAIKKAKEETGVSMIDDVIKIIAETIEIKVNKSKHEFTVEEIQDLVVKSLMTKNKDLAIAYQRYRTNREVERNLRMQYEIAGLINEDKDLVNENANKDSKTISVKRDLLAGIASRNYYLNNIVPKRVKKAFENGYIHLHDLDYLLFKETNCLGRETKFVTDKGVKSFEDFKNGDKVKVLTPFGNWKDAVVKEYGVKPLNEITFSKNGKKYIVRATANHRWLLDDESITTELKAKMHLKAPVSNFDNLNPFNFTNKEQQLFVMGFILGDGSDAKRKIENEEFLSTRIRLCGNKNQFKDIFLKHGFNEVKQFENGDNLLFFRGLNLKTLPNFEDMKPNEIQAYILGFLEADGRKSTSRSSSRFNSIYIKEKEIQDFIKRYLPVAQIFSTSSRDYSGNETNFGKRKGNPIEFNLTTYPKENKKAFLWKVESIKENVAEETVWCLEVEDDKSFVLENGITTGNCELVDLERMLKGGCKIGNAKMSEPKRIDVAVAHTIQIIASVSSNTYGGCTIPYIDRTLVPYVRKTFIEHFNHGLKYIEETSEYEIDNNLYFAEDYRWENIYEHCKKEHLKAYNFATHMTEESVKQAMQGLEYEINSLSTVNG